MTENPWIEWKGGECPVAPETVVETRFRDGAEMASLRARCWSHERRDGLVRNNWRHRGDGYEIIAYRVLSS